MKKNKVLFHALSTAVEVRMPSVSGPNSLLLTVDGVLRLRQKKLAEIDKEVFLVIEQINERFCVAFVENGASSTTHSLPNKWPENGSHVTRLLTKLREAGWVAEIKRAGRHNEDVMVAIAPPEGKEMPR